jgi:hypothetical protein
MSLPGLEPVVLYEQKQPQRPFEVRKLVIVHGSLIVS